MELKFNSRQDYQLAAIRAIVDVFEGQPLVAGGAVVALNEDQTGSVRYSSAGVGNHLSLTPEQLLQNIRAVQQRNALTESARLEPVMADDTVTELTRLNLTVEMETGTGKTYTFLRTIYELNAVYGFCKFVIVVPSVAIREGALKNLQVTHAHFQDLYGKPPINYVLYDSSKLTALRNFAASNAIQVLVINIDSFTKDQNIINTVRETGVKPIEWIQATRPIVLVDEPQNMETEIRKTAIHNLNPLCSLRYSATHKNLYNLVYSLNPVQAYDLGLVKQIEVDSITAEADFNRAYVKLESIKPAKSHKSRPQVKVEIHVTTKDGVAKKSVVMSFEDDLFWLSGGRDAYQNGYRLSSIHFDTNTIEFANGLIVGADTPTGGLSEDVVKYMMERAVVHHFEKEVRYWKLVVDKRNPSERPAQIKVLTLFFLDKVANYRDYDERGNARPGKYALWFEEIFRRLAPAARQKMQDIFVKSPEPDYFDANRVHLTDLPTGFFDEKQAHNGYFSQDKGRIKDTNGTTKADNDTYSLIMKDKERLLSFDEPLRFIFSHSALREGWDNPNVFQICTLNESRSDVRRRQEIGRGLRLAVDRTGQRVENKQINLLTIIANESVKDFAEALQREIQDETSVDFSDRVKDARAKATIKLTKALTPEANPLFFELWARIKQRTRYRVSFSTDTLIERAATALSDKTRFLRAKPSMLESRTSRLVYDKGGISEKVTDMASRTIQNGQYDIPDVFAYVQKKVDITRTTIQAIIRKSGRLDELTDNPQAFLDNVVDAIRQTLNTLLVDGVKYEQINGAEYAMSLFESAEIETYLNNLFEVTKTDKTLYNYVATDSDTEMNFARDCEADEKIKFYVKLPTGFKIPTPIGNYVPDWAVVFDNDSRIYFVVETKSTLNLQERRGQENMKIECGKKHFAVLTPADLQYCVTPTVADLSRL